uniref:Putative secreted protein ovary overexpressed n=1 Tax=Rhipicephalus microplus TaxID=6941 RepID=A0A6M2DB56_RHIMP
MVRALNCVLFYFLEQLIARFLNSSLTHAVSFSRNPKHYTYSIPRGFACRLPVTLEMKCSEHTPKRENDRTGGIEKDV